MRAATLHGQTARHLSFAFWLCALFVCPVALADQNAVISVYHHVSASTPPSTSLSPEAFRAHLSFLAENNFTVLPLTQILTTLNDGDDLPDRTVAITFDDGYESIYSTAFPLLREFGFPFTVFVSTGPIDRQQTGYMTWEQLSTLHRAAVVIGNHGTEHRSLLELSDSEARVDILAAQARITEELGPQPRLFAYPYGEFNDASKRLLADLGYAGFAQNSGAVGPTTEQTALPRFPLAGLYSGLEGATLKYSTLAFDVQTLEPLSPQTQLTAPSARVRFGEGDYSRARVACFDDGDPMAIAWEVGLSEDNVATLSTNAKQRGRRWNYVCTAPHTGSGRYFWFSQPWFDESKPQ